MKVMKIKRRVKDRLVIKFKGKNYSFSTGSLLLFPIGSVILAVILIRFFEMKENFWLQEVITKNAVSLMNLLFNVGGEASYSPENYFPWGIDIPGSIGVYINNGCTYITSMSIFTAIIIFTPHSKDPKTKEDMIWRKAIDIITSLILIYIFNIFRIAIQVYLYHLGFVWRIIHDSVLTYSLIVIIHILIFMFCNRKIPELFISIYYSGRLIYMISKEGREKGLLYR